MRARFLLRLEVLTDQLSSCSQPFPSDRMDSFLCTGVGDVSDFVRGRSGPLQCDLQPTSKRCMKLQGLAIDLRPANPKIEEPREH